MYDRKVSIKKLASIEYCERVMYLESKGVERTYNNCNISRGEQIHKLLAYKREKGVTEFPVDNGIIYGVADLIEDDDVIKILDWKPKRNKNGKLENHPKIWAGDKIQVWAYCVAFQDEFKEFSEYDKPIIAIISGYWEDEKGEIQTEELYKEEFKPLHRKKVEVMLSKYRKIINSNVPPLLTGSPRKCACCDIKDECEKLDK